MTSVSIKKWGLLWKIEGDTVEDIWPQAAFLAELPDKDDEENPTIFPTYRMTPQGHQYFGAESRGEHNGQAIRCLRIGQLKEGGLFCKGEWEAPYQGGATAAATAATRPAATVNAEDDIPF